MAKARILRQQNRCFIELPSEMQGYEEVELFFLKDGYYLVSLPLGEMQKNNPQLKPQEGSRPEKKSPINDQEMSVLRKLLAIRFENRSPEHVAKTFSKDEAVVIKELERKGYVNVFRGIKYKDGVYSINDHIYPLLISSNQGQEERSNNNVKVSPNLEIQNPPTPGQIQNVSNPSAPRPISSGGSVQAINSIASLNNQGYLVVNDRNEERNLSESLAPRMKSGNVLGVKGFDGKLYIVTREYFTRAESLIIPSMKDDMAVDAIAQACNLDPDGCRAVLRIMAENGDVIERRKGVFAPIS